MLTNTRSPEVGGGQVYWTTSGRSRHRDQPTSRVESLGRDARGGWQESDVLKSSKVIIALESDIPDDYGVYHHYIYIHTYIYYFLVLYVAEICLSPIASHTIYFGVLDGLLGLQLNQCWIRCFIKPHIHTVDGRNPAQMEEILHRWCRISSINGGAGFLPSTVFWCFNSFQTIQIGICFLWYAVRYHCAPSLLWPLTSHQKEVNFLRNSKQQISGVNWWMITSLDSGRSGEASGETVEQPAMSQIISALAPERKLIFHPQCFRCVLGKFRGGVRGIPFRVITQILPFWSSGGPVKPGICCTFQFYKAFLWKNITFSYHGNFSAKATSPKMPPSTHPRRLEHQPYQLQVVGSGSMYHEHQNGRTVAAVWWVKSYWKMCRCWRFHFFRTIPLGSS